jgi:hypothetical protein
VAKTIKVEFGEMPCLDPECDSHAAHRPVIVWKTEKNALSFTCDKCGTSLYVFPHQKAYSNWMRRMGKSESPVVPIVKAAPIPAPVPEKKKGLSWMVS